MSEKTSEMRESKPAPSRRLDFYIGLILVGLSIASLVWVIMFSMSNGWAGPATPMALTACAVCLWAGFEFLS